MRPYIGHVILQHSIRIDHLLQLLLWQCQLQLLADAYKSHRRVCQAINENVRKLTYSKQTEHNPK